MTPRRIEALIAAMLALVAVVVVAILALNGVEIAQGALIGAVGTAVSHFMHTPTPPAIDDPQGRRRAIDPPSTIPPLERR